MSDLAPLPEKKFLTIREVCRAVQLPAHVIRFWEQQFRQLKPQRRPSGHRLFTSRDVETILRIRELVRERKYTIEGARKKMTADRRRKTQDTGPQMNFGFANDPTAARSGELLREIRKEIEDIISLIAGSGA